jgi:tetratricopeptide (TPR) repeat protein
VSPAADAEELVFDKKISKPSKSSAAQAAWEQGEEYCNTGDFDKAIQEYMVAIRFDSNFTAAYFSRGMAYRAKKEYDKAIRDFKEVVKLDPKDEYTRKMLNDLLMHQLNITPHRPSTARQP